MLYLKSDIKIEKVKEMVKTHAELQVGCYFTNIESCATGQLCTSKFIDDYYWNLLSGFTEKEASNLIEDSLKCFDLRKRNQSFYLDPSNYDEIQQKEFEERGFLLEKEIWMTVLEKRNAESIDGFVIEDVDKKKSVDFLRIFSVAFGGEATENDGYGDIPSSYLDALRNSIDGNSYKNVKHKHYIGYYNGEAVGCASVHIGEKYAGLYNVGVLPKYRKKGIGAVLSLHAINEADKIGVDKIFFQTQPGGSVQRFYESLGCGVIFEAIIAYK